MSVSFGPPASVDGIKVSANERVCAAYNYDVKKNLKKELLHIIAKTHPDKARNKVLAEEVTKELNTQRDALENNALSDCSIVPARKRPAIKAALAKEMEELSMTPEEANALRIADTEARSAADRRQRAADAAEARHKASNPEWINAERGRQAGRRLDEEWKAEKLRQKMNVEHAYAGYTPAQFAKIYPEFARHYGDGDYTNNTPYGREAMRAAEAEAMRAAEAEAMRAAEAEAMRAAEAEAMRAAG